MIRCLLLNSCLSTSNRRAIEAARRAISHLNALIKVSIFGELSLLNIKVSDGNVYRAKVHMTPEDEEVLRERERYLFPTTEPPVHPQANQCLLAAETNMTFGFVYDVVVVLVVF